MRRVLQYLFLHLATSSRNSFLAAWKQLDDKQQGFFTLEDFLETTTKLDIYLSRKEATAVFVFLDQDQDQHINFVELFEFWEAAQQYLVTADCGAAGAATLQLPYAQLIQREVLLYLAQILAQRELSVEAMLRELDKDKKGQLSARQFAQFLEKLGVKIPEDTLLQQLMLMMDPK